MNQSFSKQSFPFKHQAFECYSETDISLHFCHPLCPWASLTQAIVHPLLMSSITAKCRGIPLFDGPQHGERFGQVCLLPPEEFTRWLGQHLLRLAESLTSSSDHQLILYFHFSYSLTRSLWLATLKLTEKSNTKTNPDKPSFSFRRQLLCGACGFHLTLSHSLLSHTQVAYLAASYCTAHRSLLFDLDKLWLFSHLIAQLFICLNYARARDGVW